MHLFNPKTIARNRAAQTIPTDHLSLLEAWAEMIRDRRIETLKEVALHGQFAAKIVEGVLGYQGPTSGAKYSLATEQSILRGSVDLALGRFGGKTPEILAPFELKGADTRDLDAIMPGRNKSPVQQAWEYAMNARGVKWVIVSNMIELRLYGFGEGTTAFERFWLERLTEPEEYARFILLLAADNLLSGRTLELLHESRREDKDITDSLYQDYKALRFQLINAVRAASQSIDPLQAIAIAQKILDRVLFIAFAEDTGLLPGNTLVNAFSASDPYNPRPIWDNFKGLFRAIDQGSERLKIPPYNGGLFASDATIDSLPLADSLCEGFKTLGDYDFASEVSVTVLGHIFEQSIADVERLQAQARGEETQPEKTSGTSGRRKRDGVVYTPDYIARFIVAETLGAHLTEIFTEILRAHAKKDSDLSDYSRIAWRRKTAELEAWQAYRDRLKTLRILDPACGSGVFLIMAFEFMKTELARVNQKITELEGRPGYVDDLLDPDSEILTNNLFGVDVNVESVEIAKLSLWIKTARRGKTLDSLSDNLKVGDSLIDEDGFAYLGRGFDWAQAFPEILAEGGFDILLGNPPYVRMELLKPLKPYLEQHYQVVSDRADLYCYFYERGLQLLKPGGRLGFISSNTFFKTGSGKPLRNYLLREATLEAVVDFGDLQVFEGVTTYPAILTLKKGVAPTDHALRFWKLDSLPDTNFLASWEAAAGPYPQAALGDGSWELENPSLRALRDKIRAGKKTLKEVYGSPLYGIKTGFNKAFVIDTPTKEQLCAQDPRSAELLKPFLEGKDLKRWRAEPRGLWLIYIPKNRIDIDDYPAIRDWLWPFKDKLEKRATKQAWYELQQAQEAYLPFFEGQKILYPEFCSRPQFQQETGRFTNNKCYFIGTSDTWLAGFLNSRVAWFTITGTSVPVRGGFHQMHSQYVEQAVIPRMPNEARDELAALTKNAQSAAQERLHLQQALLRRIPDLCPPDRQPKLTTKLQEWWTLPDFAAFRTEIKKTFKAEIPLAERSDWEDWINRDRVQIHRLTAEMAQAEARIDSLVYRLFELTDEEITLLEAAIETH
ncbi:Eco57I restriction-modification methylase domain-containing protein [Lamprobacter modestohalophilus]|uniref:Eco57I restriction-modification methylase domain-containing protein n=1 Tax=Lamprobacter modestohalophilus TaxID=1064514 RepID=UPI001907A690|nr:DNA methyltransferase [Lamprobacter modestohalophilus]